jgi:hypothetical protein
MTFKGMDPDRARVISAALARQLDALDPVAVDVDNTRQASLNPLSYGFDPGQWILAPWSIAMAHLAHLQLGSAIAAGRAQVAALQREIAEQERVSAGGSGADILLRIGVSASAADLDAATPADVALWWASLSRAERSQLIADNPGLIGNLDGVPYSDRDRANRALLTSMLADPTISNGQREALEAIETSLKLGPGVSKQLIILEFPNGSDPRAAIAFGNVDDADYVGLVVPGRDSTVANGMTNLSQASYNLYLQQQILLEYGHGTPGATQSVIAWMGYQTPGGGIDLGVFSDDLAIKGGSHLTDTLTGIDAVHAGSGQEAKVTVFAHSYGTRAAANSLSNDGSADAFVMFGSAGLEDDITSATELNVPDGQVYATEANGDGVADIGRNFSGDGRLDPFSDSDFGATPFGSDGSESHEATDDHGMLLSEGSGGEQNGYMDQHTESLRNMALIGLGGGSDVTAHDRSER